LRSKSLFFREILDNMDSGESIELEEVDVLTAVNFLLFATNQKPQSSESFSWNKDWFILSQKWIFTEMTDIFVQSGNQLVDSILETERNSPPIEIKMENSREYNRKQGYPSTRDSNNGTYLLVQVVDESPIYKCNRNGKFLAFLDDCWQVTNSHYNVVYARSNVTTKDKCIEVMKTPLLSSLWSEKPDIISGKTSQFDINFELILTAQTGPDLKDETETLWETIGLLYVRIPGYCVTQKITRRKDLWEPNTMARHLPKEILGELLLKYLGRG